LPASKPAQLNTTVVIAIPPLPGKPLSGIYSNFVIHWLPAPHPMKQVDSMPIINNPRKM
jgi:hypothetical protein